MDEAELSPWNLGVVVSPNSFKFVQLMYEQYQIKLASIQQNFNGGRWGEDEEQLPGLLNNFIEINWQTYLKIRVSSIYNFHAGEGRDKG